MNEVTLDLILNDMDHTLIPFIISSPFPMPMFVRQTETLPMMLGEAQTPGVHTTDASAVLKEHRKRCSKNTASGDPRRIGHLVVGVLQGKFV